MNGGEIRSVAEADIDQLQMIDRTAHGESWSHRLFLEDLNGTDRVHLVAVEGESVVGHASAWIDGSTCRITNVAVSSDRQRLGYGTSLVAALLNQVQATFAVTQAQLEVRATNRGAQRLYSQLGFAPVGVERSFYGRSDQTSNRDAVVMVIDDLATNRFAQSPGGAKWAQ